MILYIKYMVSLRCKMLVKEELKKLGFEYFNVELGRIELLEPISEAQRTDLDTSLRRAGLEIIDNPRAVLIQKIKNIIVDMVHYQEEIPRVNNSEYISEALHYDYTYLSNMFSEVNGCTIEHFIILHKIERAKELILYDQLNLTEISYKLNYSSVAHLSNQFKKITGLTPSFFKKLQSKRSGNLENL